MSATSTGTFLLISDGSISMWILRAFGAYVFRLPVTRSSKRIPAAIRRSASWIAWLTHASPCMPIMPKLSACDAGRQPIPSSVIATGICPRSASDFS